MNEDIYNMKLHEEISINSMLTVLRVPGGWNYTNYQDVKGSYTEHYRTNTVFVPFSTEFQPLPELTDISRDIFKKYKQSLPMEVFCNE